MMSNTSMSRARTVSKPTEKRVYGGVSGDQRQIERRSRLIAAGIVCFGRDGYVATTTRSIAAESGLSQRYFYESFDGVDDFFAQVVRELGEELEASINAAVQSAPPRLEDRLRAALAAYFTSIRRKRYVGRIMVIEAFNATPTTRQTRQFLSNVAELMRSIILADLPKAPDRSANLELLTTGYVGATHHIALRWVLGGFTEPPESMVDAAARLIMGSLRDFGLVAAQRNARRAAG